jgi:uncharacterized protein (TIGR02246 family)
MSASRRLCIALAALVVAGCATKDVDHAAVGAEVMQVSREWAQAANGDDVERIVSYWAEDAVVLPPDQEAVRGREAIRAFVREMQKVPGFSVTWEPESATVSSDGSMAYLVERSQFTFNDANGVRHTQHGKSVTVWRKDASGAWKCVVDIWNNRPNPPAGS